VNMTQLTLEDVNYMCTTFPCLEHLCCSVASPNVDGITQAIVNGRNLRSIKLLVQWIPDMPSSSWDGGLDVDKGWNTKDRDRFTVDDAKSIMLSNMSRIRVIEIGSNVYKGRWVRRKEVDETTGLVFEVLEDVAEDRWR